MAWTAGYYVVTDRRHHCVLSTFAKWLLMRVQESDANVRAELGPTM